MQTLLIADDNRLSRELLRDVLESAECRVVEAVDGGEALRRVEAERPDVVLLDLEMPVKNGFEVLAALRSDPRFSGIPVVAVTARAMGPDRERVIRAGFDAYFTKPIDAAAMRRRVRELAGVPGSGGRR